MNKTLKKFLILLAVLILLFALFMAAWVFLIFPRFVSPNRNAQTEPGIVDLANASEKVDLNESNGLIYVNNELVVFASPAASPESVRALLEPLGAQIDASMADIFVYRLVFKEAMSYEDLEALILKIKAEPIIEDAYLNPVTELTPDTTTSEDDFDYRGPFYPNDAWNGDTWNVRVPGGENWGMEAIDAPGAWGYLDQLSTVKIGLIDSMPDLDHPDLSVANSSCLFVDENTGEINPNKYSLYAKDHGTHVAGTMNAKWNNTTGVCGVLGGKGELYYSAVYYDSNGKISEQYATAYSYLLALKTLIDQDVQVINISQNTNRLIGFAASHGNQNAINYLSMQADLTEKGLSRIIEARQSAHKPDFVICVAAGNSNATYYFEDEKEPYGYREKMTDAEAAKWLYGWRGEIGGSLALYNNFLNLMDAEAVKSRVIVVGAVGIDLNASTPNNTQYEYTYYSNVGSRVDVVAPGGIPGEAEVYSCIVDGYGNKSGTSMATPHVSGVAGLIFASNPSLSGPDVKSILCASTTGRYYHGNAYSGLLNANTAVVNGLKTNEASVEKVLKTEVDNGLDLCFVVDTTGSMGDDIENAKENMTRILEHLAEKTENYRVALVDYRDYSERTNDPLDYPCNVQLPFTNNNDRITAAIYDLNLGYGGDDEETVYSGLMAAVSLDWRKDAKKVIIILGDAAPLDPEPYSGYTYEDVLRALFNADIQLDYEASDDRVVEDWDASQINVFSIGTDASADAADFFEKIALSTGGSYAGVDDASKVSDAIIDSIEQIEVVEKYTVSADFGEELAHQKIHLYSNDDTYLFTIETDEDGEFVLDSVEAGTYRWRSNTLYAGGTLAVNPDRQDAAIRVKQTYWFSPLLQLWYQHTALICIAVLAFIALCIAVPVSVKKIRIHIRKRKAQTPPKTELVPEPTQAEFVSEPTQTVLAPAPSLTQTESVSDPAPISADAPALVPAPNLLQTESVSDPALMPADAPALEENNPPDDDLVCPNCGFHTTIDAQFCGQCGCNLKQTILTPPERVCPQCGTPYKEHDLYCGKCGAKLDGDTE